MASFDQILMQWLGGYSKGHCPMEADARISALKELFATFKKEGYLKTYFTNSIKAKITTNCINPNHSNRGKKKRWIELVNKHMEIAFYYIYSEKVDVEENDMLAKNVCVEDLTLTKEELDQEIQNITQNTIKVCQKNKDEIFAETATKGVPTVNQIDPEMAKLLGLSDE
jgi:hypothetical protein